MKILNIFDAQLFAIQYEGEADNEYDRLVLDLWMDVSYLRQFAKDNGVEDVNKFANDRLRDNEDIQDHLENLRKNNTPYSFYFEALDLSEFNRELARQKGKRTDYGKNGLRLYAIKIEENCYLITGGAIKMSQRMEEHADTALELKKLNDARNYLQKNGVSDEETFFELINEKP